MHIKSGHVDLEPNIKEKKLLWNLFVHLFRKQNYLVIKNLPLYFCFVFGVILPYYNSLGVRITKIKYGINPCQSDKSNLHSYNPFCGYKIILFYRYIYTYNNSPILDIKKYTTIILYHKYC